MSCTETRELFSALADDALGAEERVALDAHLAGCADCRRELAGFERTVRMVRAMDPVRAPAGFVDRVLAAARPQPWPRRMARRLFVPWPKVPLEAAALLLIAGLAVLLFRGSPEQQRAVRDEATPPGPAAPAPAPQSAPTAPAATREVAPRDVAAAKRREEPGSPADQRAAVAPRSPAAPEPKADEAPQASRESRRGKLESEERAPAKDAANTLAKARRDAAGAPAAAAPPAVAQGAVEVPGRERAAKSQALPEAAPLSRAGPMTGLPGAPPDVAARLRVADPAAAERALIELAARVGGRQTGRRIDGGRVAVEVAVPLEAYARFVREAAALGALSIERQAIASPTVRAEIRLEPEAP
jgi:hypothetical protein